MISHEIRTPLNVIYGLCELLWYEAKLETTCGYYLGTVLASSTILLSIINDILDFSKFHTSAFTLEPSHCFLRSTIEMALTPLVSKATLARRTLA